MIRKILHRPNLYKPLGSSFLTSHTQCCMGLFYEGVLCENWEEMPKDYQKAMNWYLLSATQSNATAQNNLGLMYYQGIRTPQNYKEALRLFRLAAEQGYEQAQLNLGGMYFNGRGVFRKTIKKQSGYIVLLQNRDMQKHNSIWV